MSVYFDFSKVDWEMVIAEWHDVLIKWERGVLVYYRYCGQSDVFWRWMFYATQDIEYGI